MTSVPAATEGTSPHGIKPDAITTEQAIEKVEKHGKSILEHLKRIPKEVAEFKPPADLTKKQRIIEFCKGFFFGILPILALVAGIVVACVYGGATVAAAVGGAVPASIFALGIIAAITGKLSTWIIWTLQKMKTAFSTQPAKTDGMESSKDVQIIFSSFLKNLEALKQLHGEVEHDSTRKASMFKKEYYSFLVRNLQENAKRFHITVTFKTSLEDFIKKLNEDNVSTFGQLEDEVSFQVDEATTPSNVKKLIRILQPSATQRDEDERVDLTYKNTLQFLVKPTPEEREALQSESEADEANPLANFDDPTLSEEGSALSIVGLRKLTEDLNQTFGLNLIPSVQPPKPGMPYGILILDEERLRTHQLSPSQEAVAITPELIKKILFKHREEISGEKRAALPGCESPNKGLYQQWLAEISRPD